MQSVVRQRGNIAHAGENMFRAIGKALNFLRVGDAAKQSKAHTPFGGCGLEIHNKAASSSDKLVSTISHPAEREYRPRRREHASGDRESA